MASPTMVLGAIVLSVACSSQSSPRLSTTERTAIGDSVRSLLVSTITFDSGDVVRRFMSLYPASGPVISAANGAFSTTRDSLQMGLVAFWENVGRRMRRPKWTWGPMVVDVLDRDAVAITARYTVPHWTPAGAPHVIGGTWTSVWSRRGGRWVIVQEHLSDMPRSFAEKIEAVMPSIPDSSSK